jgi:hypothetical protein
MKMLFILFCAIILISSCDSPRDRRILSTQPGVDMSQVNSSASRVNIANTTASANSSTGTTTATTNTPTIPTDASHCHFATDGINGFQSTSTHLGNYTLCQSSSDKNMMYFQLQTPPKTTTLPQTNISICFIPTVSSGSNSIYVGNPMCGQFPTPTSVQKITFVKFPQYQSAVINGAIFFKDLAYNYPYPYDNYAQTMTLDAYNICMQAISTPPYYNTLYCQAFKQLGQYVYQQF